MSEPLAPQKSYDLTSPSDLTQALKKVCTPETCGAQHIVPQVIEEYDALVTNLFSELGIGGETVGRDELRLLELELSDLDKLRSVLHLPRLPFADTLLSELGIVAGAIKKTRQRLDEDMQKNPNGSEYVDIGWFESPQRLQNILVSVLSQTVHQKLQKLHHILKESDPFAKFAPEDARKNVREHVLKANKQLVLTFAELLSHLISKVGGALYLQYSEMDHPESFSQFKKDVSTIILDLWEQRKKEVVGYSLELETKLDSYVQDITDPFSHLPDGLSFYEGNGSSTIRDIDISPIRVLLQDQKAKAPPPDISPGANDKRSSRQPETCVSEESIRAQELAKQDIQIRSDLAKVSSSLQSAKKELSQVQKKLRAVYGFFKKIEPKTELKHASNMSLLGAALSSVYGCLQTLSQHGRIDYNTTIADGTIVSRSTAISYDTADGMEELKRDALLNMKKFEFLWGQLQILGFVCRDITSIRLSLHISEEKDPFEYIFKNMGTSFESLAEKIIEYSERKQSLEERIPELTNEIERLEKKKSELITQLRALRAPSFPDS